MNTVLAQLLKLQKLDLTIRSLGHQLQQISKKNKVLDDKVAPQRDNLEAVRKEIVMLDDRSSSLTETLENLDEKERKQKLKIPEVRSNDEYSALLREMDAVKRERDKTENQSLEDMERLEELKKSLPELEEALAEAEKTISSERKEVDSERTGLEDELIKVKEERKTLEKEMSPGWFRKYTSIAAQRNGLAVVSVKSQTCQGCFMGIRPKLVQDLHYDEEVVFCEGCSRILYLEEE